MHRIALVFFVALLAAQLAMAQSGDRITGRLDAHICEKLPSPLKIDVQILDNAPRYVRLRDKFIARMNEDGIEMVTGAPYVLMLYIKTVRDFQQSDKSYIGELRIGKGGDVSVRGKIWSNSDDSVLGGRKKSSGRRTVNQLQVTADLNRRDDGRCVWQGKILHELRSGDPDNAAYHLMPILAGAIGRSIQNKPVNISEQSRSKAIP
jgi:hypothetical protein